jgi:hypothetical protein
MKLIALAIVAVILVGFTVYSMSRPGQLNFGPMTGKIESTEAEPIRKAKTLYQNSKKNKVDFSASPCLSEDIGGGWAVDIIHNPRIVKDDEVQCTAYEEGKVTHIVEMTPDGNVVRAE